MAPQAKGKGAADPKNLNKAPILLSVLGHLQSQGVVGRKDRYLSMGMRHRLEHGHPIHWLTWCLCNLLACCRNESWDAILWFLGQYIIRNECAQCMLVLLTHGSPITALQGSLKGMLPSTAWMEWRHAMKNWTQTSVVECQEGTHTAFLCFLTTLSKIVQWHVLSIMLWCCWWLFHAILLVTICTFAANLLKNAPRLPGFKAGLRTANRIESNWEMLPSNHQCGSTSPKHNQFHRWNWCLRVIHAARRHLQTFLAKRKILKLGATTQSASSNTTHLYLALSLMWLVPSLYENY